MADNNKSYNPDWRPKDAGSEFAVKVVKGVSREEKNQVNQNSAQKFVASIKRNQPTVDALVKGVLKSDRVLLARTITLIESNSEAHQQKAQKVLNKLLHKSGDSIRIGITGVPGAGKSTLIEILGMYLIEKGFKVAVLAVDPSSTVTKGSILGDKTRMEKLSREANCFIRPSPSSGTLGGVTRKSRETFLVCEAAGYDVILIETVGVGQSEVTVRSMVDFFLLVMIAGAGDELQGIKKGVIELADALLVNKADGDNEKKANVARSEYANALHYLQPATKGWETRAFTCSAITGKGIKEIWELILKFKEISQNSGEFEVRRKNQLLDWVFTMIEDELKHNFYNNNSVRTALPNLKSETLKENILPTKAAEKLLNIFYRSKS